MKCEMRDVSRKTNVCDKERHRRESQKLRIIQQTRHGS